MRIVMWKPGRQSVELRRRVAGAVHSFCKSKFSGMSSARPLTTIGLPSAKVARLGFPK
jgi:hypothetical protein